MGGVAAAECKELLRRKQLTELYINHILLICKGASALIRWVQVQITAPA